MTMEQWYRQTIKKTQTLECYGYRVIELWECEYDKKYKEDSEFRQMVDAEFTNLNPLRPKIVRWQMHCSVAETIRRGYTIKLTQGLKMKSSTLMFAHSTHSFASMDCFYWGILPSCLRRTSTKTILSNTVD